MTREEAIAILEVSKHMATSGRMYNQAIDMAIEALSAPSGDVISRADVMGAVAKLDRYDVDERNRLRAYTPFHGAEAQTFIDVVDLYQALEALPSADAVPQSEQYKKGFEDAKRAYDIEYARESIGRPHGEWQCKSLSTGEMFYGCSECGNLEINTSNFCPNCGAKMDKGGDTE